MIDALGRRIDYMRLSLTDRCNLRCKYCMPQPVPDIPHPEILRYEEFLRICRCAVELGITKFKLTGGEPLARRGAAEFAARLKGLPGVEQVTITTNGLLLRQALPALVEAGIDGINLSLDTIDPARYAAITGRDQLAEAMAAAEAAAASGVPTKLNAVLLGETAPGLPDLVAWADSLPRPVDVRLIELMPLGCAAGHAGPTQEEALALLRARWPDLRPAPAGERRGNGPASYFLSDTLQGRVGFIAANTHIFCQSCNRVRVTSTGGLKPCLCYARTADLRALLRGGADDRQLTQAIRQAVYQKPAAHCFAQPEGMTEHARMNEIGG